MIDKEYHIASASPILWQNFGKKILKIATLLAI